MANPYLGEIRVVGFNFAPRGWFTCNGQTLAISQYTALFALIGTFYGGNGTSTFQLPNLQSRVPIHQGTGAGLSTYDIGELSGTETVTILQTEMPAHSHLVNVSTAAGTQSSPSGGTLGQNNTGTAHAPVTNVPNFVTTAPNATLAATTIANAGGSVPHNNLQPFLVLNFIIAYEGVFPSRN